MKTRSFLASALLVFASFLGAGEVRAQSGCQYIQFGAVLTAGQWNACFSAKQDALGFTPISPSNLIGTPPIVVTNSGGITTISLASSELCTAAGAFPVGTGSTTQCSTVAGSTATLNGGPLTVNASGVTGTVINGPAGTFASSSFDGGLVNWRQYAVTTTTIGPTFTLSGTVTSGETISLSVFGQTFSYTFTTNNASEMSTAAASLVSQFQSNATVAANIGNVQKIAVAYLSGSSWQMAFDMNYASRAATFTSTSSAHVTVSPSSATDFTSLEVGSWIALGTGSRALGREPAANDGLGAIFIVGETTGNSLDTFDSIPFYGSMRWSILDPTPGIHKGLMSVAAGEMQFNTGGPWGVGNAYFGPQAPSGASSYQLSVYQAAGLPFLASGSQLAGLVELTIQNEAAANAANAAVLNLAVNSSTQIRSAALLTGLLTGTTDATRTGAMQMTMPAAGTVTLAATVTAANFNIGPQLPAGVTTYQLSVYQPTGSNAAIFSGSNSASIIQATIQNEAAVNALNTATLNFAVNSSTQVRSAFSINALLSTTTDASRTGTIQYVAPVNGSQIVIGTWGPGLQVGSAPTGGDKGTGSINLSADYYKNGAIIGETATAPITLSAGGAIGCATCATTTSGGALSATSPIAISAGGVISISATPSFNSVEHAGTAGAGFAGFVAQSSAPSAPAGGFRLYADSSGRLSWIRQSDGFSRTFDATLTASRVYTLQDATYTIIGRDTTDTLTNKTYDTAGTGNSFLIAGVAVTANTGTGAVARAANPVFTGPTLGVATGTSLAIGGGSIGTDALEVTGTTTLNGNVTLASASFIMSGNISAAAWTTNGLRIKGVAATFTDTSSSGTVATAYTDVFGGNTIAASSATTFTNYVTAYFKDPVQGTNVTLSNKWALGADSLRIGTSSQLTVSNSGVLTATNAALTTPAIGSATGVTLIVTDYVSVTSYTQGLRLKNEGGTQQTVISSSANGRYLLLLNTDGTPVFQAGNTNDATLYLDHTTIQFTNLANSVNWAKIDVNGVTVQSGNVTMSTAAKTLVLKQGANGTVGTFVCNGTSTVTVSNTNVAISDAIVFSLNTVGGTVGFLPSIKTITAGTGFTLQCTLSDTSTYNYAIIKNAAWLLERDLAPANDNRLAFLPVAA